MTVSIGAKVQQIEGLHDTSDVSAWENEFIASVVTKTQNGKDTRALTDKQIEVIERIWSKHFA